MLDMLPWLIPAHIIFIAVIYLIYTIIKGEEASEDDDEDNTKAS